MDPPVFNMGTAGEEDTWVVWMEGRARDVEALVGRAVRDDDVAPAVTPCCDDEEEEALDLREERRARYGDCGSDVDVDRSSGLD